MRASIWCVALEIRNRLSNVYSSGRRSSGQSFSVSSVVDSWCGQASPGVEQFFSIVFALCGNFTASVIWKMASRVCFVIFLNICLVAIWPWVCREKYFSRVFLEYSSWKHGILVRIFVSRFVFFQRHSCQCLQLCCSETTFAKQRLAFTAFWHNTTFFLLI